AADVKRPEGPVSRERLVPVDEPTLDARRGVPADERRGLGGGPLHDGGQPLQPGGAPPQPGQAHQPCPKAHQPGLLGGGPPGLVEVLQFTWTGLLSHGFLLGRFVTLAAYRSWSISTRVDMLYGDIDLCQYEVV